MLTLDCHRVLAAFSHPDDAELACFGTLALLRSLGADISLLILTNGERTSSSCAGARRDEAAEAAQLVGAELLFGNLPDGAVSYDRETISMIDDYLRKTSPDLVITHFPLADGFGHQDHEQTAYLVTNATLRALEPPSLMYAEPPVSTARFQPNLFIDVTQHFSVKLDALACHRCERSKPVVRPMLLEIRAAWWAQQARADATAGDRYEAFYLVRGITSGCPQESSDRD